MTVKENAGKAWDLGFQPWPVRHDGSKAPRGDGWGRDELPERLDRATTLEMFRPNDTGMGIITGIDLTELFEFEGRFVADDGWDEFISACNDRGLGDVLERIRQGYELASPSGGIHLLFRTEGPAAPNTVLAGRDVDGTIRPLIETRGDRGFAILAGSNGSIHPDGGSWRILRGKPGRLAVITCEERDALYALAREFDEAPEKPRYVAELHKPGSGIGLETGSDYGELHDQIDPRELLVEAGWTFVRAQRSGSELWRRPGKDWGNSGELWPDGHFSVYTSTLPQAWREALGGKEQLSPVGLLAAVRHGGDFRAAASATRRSMTVSSTPPVADTGGSDGGGGLNLPDEFWAQRPFLEHIRTAAWSRGASADAILGTLLARYACVVPTQFHIPPIVMARSTFDHLTCLASDSAGGKSGAMSIAGELFPEPTRKDLVWNCPNPTGEGLIAAFYEWVVEDNGGRKERNFKKTKTAVMFSSDEGMALVQASKRDSSTISSVLCTAWSGGNPGSTAASADRNRPDLKPGTFRISGVTAIQYDLGYHLLTEELARQGFSGRVTFFAATDPKLPRPEEQPEFPGPLTLPVHPTTQRDLEYPAEVVAEIREAHWRKQTGQTIELPIDGHLRLSRLKISGLLAMMDGRLAVDMVDWDLAGTIIETSTRIRRHMQELEAGHRAVAAAGKAKAEAGHRIMVGEELDRAARQRLTKMAATQARHVEEAGGRISRGELRKKLKSSMRDQFDEILDLNIELGVLTEDGDEIVL